MSKKIAENIEKAINHIKSKVEQSKKVNKEHPFYFKRSSISPEQFDNLMNETSIMFNVKPMTIKRVMQIQ